VIAGPTAFIEDARLWKHRLGGAMRQAGIIAAAGVYAFENNVERLAEAIRVSDQQTGGIASNLRNMSNGTYHGDTPEARKRSQGTATLSHKDLSAAIELAGELGIELPVAAHIESLSDVIFGVEKAPATR